MNALTELAAPITWTCSGLAAALLLAGLPERRRPLRTLGALLLLMAAAGLTLALADPALLPARSALVHPDGSTDDPRVLSALMLGAAALLALGPAARPLRLSAMGAVSLALPGIVLAGLLGAVASFVHLHQPAALAGIAVGAFVAATALVLAARSRTSGHAPLALQAFATGALVVAGMLSLHGARLGNVALGEGAAIDTLGQRLVLASVEAPTAERRVLHVVLYGGRDSLVLRPELRGAKGSDVRSVADARWWTGPIIVPIALEERRPSAHAVQWIDKSAALAVGDASIRLAGFRFVKGDTIRLFADLDVTTAAGTERISPGVLATRHGEIPFAAQARGFGPIAVAGIDADHGRVGLVLPKLSDAGMTRVASLDMRLRPALPVAWAALVLAVLAWLFSVASRPAEPARD